MLFWNPWEEVVRVVHGLFPVKTTLHLQVREARWYRSGLSYQIGSTTSLAADRLQTQLASIRLLLGIVSAIACSHWSRCDASCRAAAGQLGFSHLYLEFWTPQGGHQSTFRSGEGL
jgi:hypothetical protein